MPTPLLSISDLHVRLGGRVVLRGVSLHLPERGRLALVGDSGCGKTTLLRAVLGLLPAGAEVAGSILWTDASGSTELLTCPPRRLRALRRGAFGLIPQEPSAALDPRRSADSHLNERLRP